MLENCSAIDIDFSGIDVKNLEDFAVRARYPYNYLAPELSEAMEYYQIALTIKEMIIQKIKKH